MRYRLSILILIILFFTILPGFAAEPPLFLPTDLVLPDSDAQIELNQNMTYEESHPFLLRQRYMAIDTAVLSQSIFQLNLFDDSIVTAVIDRKEERSAGQFSLFGAIPEIPNSYLYFVVDKDQVTGNVTVGNQKFHIRWMGGTIHSIAEVDWQNIPQSGEPLPANEVAPSPAPAPGESPISGASSPDIPISAAPLDDGSRIDVLVVYTQAAAARGNIHSEIQLAVDHMNTSLTNSDVTLTIKLVHTDMVDYDETGNALTDINRLANPGDGYMDGMHSLRDRYGADLVALITESMNDWCGLGMVNSSSPHPDVAFHVTRRLCLTYGTFAHEVGHNLGMAHEKYQSPTGGAYTYSHGYVDLVNKFSTIMAYGTECRDNGFNCTPIDYYSAAPASGVQYGGNDIGHAADADNRQTVINTKTAVSQFRQSKAADDEDLSGGCFIATAAYGTYLSPKVKLLRNFRDRYLIPYPLGQAAVGLYYKISPSIAHTIGQHPLLKGLTRLFLAPLIFMIEYFWSAILLFSGTLLLWIFRKRLKRGVSFGMLCLGLIGSMGWLSPAKAQIASPSFYAGEPYRNPATLMQTESPLMGFQRNAASGKTDTLGSTEEETLTVHQTEAFLTYPKKEWAIHFSTLLSGTEKIDNHNTSSSSVNSGSDSYEKKTARSIFSVAIPFNDQLNLGGRLDRLTIQNERYQIKDRYDTLGAGLNYSLNKSIFIGAGGDYTQAREDQKVQNNYIGFYAGVALQEEFIKGVVVRGEASLTYSPEDGAKKRGDKAASYHRKTQETNRVGEAIVDQTFLFMFRVYEKTVFALSTRPHESDEITTLTSLGVGYRKDALLAEFRLISIRREKGTTLSTLTGTQLTLGLRF